MESLTKPPRTATEVRGNVAEAWADPRSEDNRHAIQCSIHEISESMGTDDILSRNEALFSTLIELVPIGVYVIDARFQMQQINPSAINAFGNLHPLIGRDFSEIVHILWPNPIADELIARFRLTLETGETCQSTEFTERRQDTGMEEIYDWQIQRITLPAGEYGVVCFFNNITVRKKAEDSQRLLDVLTAANLKLKKEIVRRQALEESLHKTQQEQILLLVQSRHQEELLRDMSYRILSAQEEERKRISHELLDVISQNLIGINVSMAALAKGDPATFRGDFRRKMAETQRIVESSVERLHDHARELRPSILDDLGLIPALHTLLERFMMQTGIRASLTAFAGIEEWDGHVLTAIYRLVQEALAQIAQHALSSQVAVRITTADGCIVIETQDDGSRFEETATTIGRHGLLGMRERVEMLGGCFEVDSRESEGTIVRATFSKSKS